MKNSNENIRFKTLVLYVSMLFRQGLCKICSTTQRRVLLALYPFVLLGFSLVTGTLVAEMETALAATLLRGLLQITIPLAGLVAMLGLIVFVGTPLSARSVNDNLRRAGLLNSTGESPLLLDVYKDTEHSNVHVLDLLSLGITPADVEDVQANLEAALDLYIVKAEHGKSLRHLLLHVVPAGEALPAVLPWDGGKLSGDDFVAVLGEDLMRQPVTVNLDVTPMVMFGGDAGSGKTWLLKLFLHQCKAKGAFVVIADRKGGMDFTADLWRDCPLHIDNASIERQLAELVEEVNRRFPVFRAAKCNNLTAYNRKMMEAGEPPLKRIIFACDEASQLLDKTGLPKQEKDEIEVISAHLRTIARLGRAVGVHLALAQQRPSADVIPGDVKNNMSFRCCGRADDVLSRILLDNGDAATRIPKDSQGRFLTNSGILFQAYKLDEDEAFREGGSYHDETD